MDDFLPDLSSLNPDKLRRMAQLTSPLKAGTLDPANARPLPDVSVPASSPNISLTPTSLGPSNTPTDVSRPPSMPSLGTGLPDPNDPKYHPQGRHGIVPALEAAGIGLIGGYQGIEDFWNKPKTDAAAQYDKDRQSALDTSTIQDRQAQEQERSTKADLDIAQARKALNAPNPPKSEDLNQIHADAVDDAISRGVDPSKDPKVLQIEDSIQRVQKEPAPKTPNEAEQSVSDYLAGKNLPDTPANRTAARFAIKAAERPPKDTSARDDARSDKSYQFNSGQLEKERTPIEASMQKISGALTNLNLKSPQADALLAPQILSLTAGGAGSGLRMNEAEISRILGGRTAWETLQATLNKYSADPTHVQIPEAQRAQMQQIVQAAQQKGTLKQQILESGEGKLVNSDDPKDHRMTVTETKKLLDAVDRGERIQRNKATGEFRIAGEQ